MFKKLKERVEGAESPEKDGSSSPAARRRSSMPVSSKGRQRVGLHKTDSTSSLSSITEADITSGRMSTDELLSALMQRTTQVKKLEIKLADYTQALKECSKEKDKLTLVLEKQQDSSMKRLSELEETYSEGKTKMEKVISKLEKKEANHAETINALRAEKQKLQETVDKYESDKDDFEKKRDQFFANRDNSEELNDLQMQEMAKLKHMLMLREKECEKYRDELDQKLAEFLQCQDRSNELESSLRVVTESLNSNRKELEIKIKETENLAESNSSLDEDNKKLEDKLSTLSTDFKQTQSTLSALESSHSEISEKYESLKHSSDAVIQRATVELDEKQGTIEHLKEKIILLEKRVSTDNLPENEQVQALITERTSLENKLEESHLQLNNIKSTWSVKINQLEQQVSNLNTKIAEDHEELVSKDEKISELVDTITKSSEESLKLQKELHLMKKDLGKSIRENEDCVGQIAELEANLLEQSSKFNLDRSKLKKDLDDANTMANETGAKFKEEIQKLKDQSNDFESKILSLESENQSLKSVVEEKIKFVENAQTLSSSLQEECDKLEVMNKQLEGKLKSAEVKLTTSNEDSSNVKEQICNIEKELQDKSEELDKVKSNFGIVNSDFESVKEKLEGKETELSHYKDELNRAETQVKEMEAKFETMDSSLLAREEEVMKCKEEIALLRNSHAEDSDEVTSLKQDRTKFEEQLAERDRTIKVQQQRLNDLKKALSKELNKKSSTTLRTDNRTPSPKCEVNGYGSSSHLNNSEDSGPDEASMSMSDTNLSTVNSKYLKHVILTFLGGSQSEAQQLVKAMSVLLNFNKDEEKFVKEVLEYRGSWFGAKPPTKKLQSLLKSKKR